MAKYAFLTLGMIFCITSVAVAQNPITADSPYQVRYAKNLQLGDASITIANTGASSGNPLCANVYGFAATTGQMTSCCSCLIPPNALVSLSVWTDMLLDSPPVVPAPNALVIKLLSGLPFDFPPGAPPTCFPDAPSSLPGLAAWGTTPQPSGGFNSPPLLTETAFTPSTVSTAELNSIATQCEALHGNIAHACPSCPFPKR